MPNMEAFLAESSSMKDQRPAEVLSQARQASPMDATDQGAYSQSWDVGTCSLKQRVGIDKFCEELLQLARLPFSSYRGHVKRFVLSWNKYIINRQINKNR